MSTEENKALVRQYMESVNAQHVAAWSNLLATDHVSHAPGFPLIQGAAALKQVASLYFTAFPDLQVTFEDLIAEGDKVVARFTNCGTHKGELMGMPATGKQVAFTAIYIFRLAGGKIAEQWIEYDALGMMQQLGVIPPMGEAS